MIKTSKDCLYWTEKPTLTGSRTKKEGHRIAKCEGRQVKYSEHDRVPDIGERITISMNSIGPAVVKGYFIEFEFVGVLAVPVTPPDWWKRQNADYNGPLKDCCGVFGSEIELTEKGGS